MRAVLLGTNPVGYAGCCAAVRDMDQRALLGEIKVPVLVIAGDDDVSTPWVGHGDLLTAEIAGARAVRLAAAHLSNVDRPSAFCAALFDFLLPAAGDPRDTGGIGGAAGGAGRCARGPGGGRGYGVDPGISGMDHALCVGRGVGAAGDGSARAAVAGAGDHGIAGPLGGVPAACADRVWRRNWRWWI